MDNHTSETPLKKCSKCKRELPATLDYFYKKGGRNCLFGWCKSCHNLKTGKASLEWNKSHPDRVKASADRYREKHGERVKVKAQIRRAMYPEEGREKTKNWRLNNPEKHAAKEQRRRARKLNLPDQFNAVDWQRALNYFDGCCAVCGRQLNDLFGTHKAGMDHWIPITSPDCPGTVKGNIVPLCHGQDGCNNSKGNKDAREWVIDKFGKRKAKQILKRIETYFEWVKNQ